MQSIGLALTQGLVSLQSALPAAAKPSPQPTFNYNGKVASGVETFTNNLTANVLYLFGGVFFIYALVIAVKMLGGAPKLGGRFVFAVFMAIVCLVPASAMTWANGFFQSLMS
jgi:hypothetical protein